MKVRVMAAIGVVTCLGACSEIPEVCENDQGGAIACALLDMSPDADMEADMATEQDAAADLDQKDASPDLEQADMCVPMDALQVCNGICGMQADGCGGQIDCGEPMTQAEVCADACGEQSDGCGGTITCEPCACVGGQPAQPTCGACNLGVSSCDGDTFSCDLYDIPGLDAQTDCDSALIHVNAAFDGQMSDGSRGAPFKTIAEANAAAKERGAIAILVGGNENVVYEEVLSMQDGVSIVGGWSKDWTVDRVRTPTITPALPASGDLYGARIIDIADTDTLLANMRIITPNFGKAVMGPGRHNHGVYASNSGRLIMRDMFIQSGKGEGGADGAAGEAGADGQAGEDGEPGCGYFWFGCSAGEVAGNIRIQHLEQDNILCDASLGDTRSGRNGLGGESSQMESEKVDTATNGGNGSPASMGGVRGRPTPVAAQKYGSDGQDGVILQFTPSPGTGGQCHDISFSDANWTLSTVCHGTDGGPGRNGGGGGGGGGASHGLTRFMPYVNANEESVLYVYGPDGGSGGTGGCAGMGGRGGMSGGGSVGLIVESSLSLLIEGSVISSTGGGLGGKGGDGGMGGMGGQGGAGSTQVCTQYDNGSPITTSCTGADYAAGNGGSGAKGIDGSRGGGGGGGFSIGIYCAKSSSLERDVSTRVQVAAPAAGGGSGSTSGVVGLSEIVVGCP